MLLYTIIVCTNSVYSLASLFLPVVFREKDVPGFWVGLVFAMYSIAGMIVSPVIGKILHRIGSSNTIAIGLVIMGLSIMPLSYLAEMENDSSSLALALLLRAMQGTASASINTTCFGMAANKYSDQTQFMMGMLEGVSGIGLVIGLMGGSLVYESMGYEAVFLTFGGLLLLMALISRLIFSCLERRVEIAVEGPEHSEQLLEERQSQSSGDGQSDER